jgi:hypothetical protein
MDCRYSAVEAIECSAAQAGTVLKVNLELIPPDGTAQKLKSRTSSGVGKASWNAPGLACSAISTRISRENDTVRLSGHHDCAAPVRLCVDIQTPLPEASFLNNVAVIQTKSLTMAIMGDSRLGTQIDLARKAVRLCSDPKGLNSAEWTIDLRSGSSDQIRDVLQGLPAPLVDSTGKSIGYSKKSPVIKDGYFFVELTEKNAPALLPLIQRSYFPYTLIYGSTWATSMGSYGFNPANYPGGLAGLKHVVEAANSLGIKVGLHTLTSFVSKTDPYVQNGVPDARLLQDDRSTLLDDIDAQATTISAADSLGTFPTQPAFYGARKAGLDIRIGDEIISCPTIVVGEHGQFKACKRGLYGTRASAHPAGTPIGHLAERYGSYLADLGSSMKDEIGLRLSGVVNQAGIDMIYFDGGEVGGANGDAAWYVAEQQIEILKHVRRPLLVEGSGIVPRLWPFITRMAADDFAALAAVVYLDTHKIGQAHKNYINSMMPDNLGWLGLLKETPSYPATTPEEMSTYVARSLALDVPLAIETHYDDLLKNPYTGRLMDILRAGNQTIRAGVLAPESRARLAQGDWYYTENDGARLKRLRLSRARTGVGSAAFAPLTAAADEQQALLRIRNVTQTSLAAAETIPLFDDSLSPKVVNEVAITAANRGVLVDTINLSQRAAAGQGSSFVDFVDRSLAAGTLDLRSARRMVVDFDYPASGGAVADARRGSCAVLNLQLADNRENYRDYFLPLSPGVGQRALLDYESSASRMLREFMPAASSYAFKAAVYGFNFAAITKLNLRWMNSCGQGVPVRLLRVAMLKERSASLGNIRLNVGNKAYPLGVELGTGTTLDVFPDGQVTVCKEAVCSTRTINWPSGSALSGHAVSVDYAGDAGAEITLGLLGEGVEIGADQAQRR